MMKDSAFERIVARLVKELLNDGEVRCLFDTEFTNAQRIGDKSKMDQIRIESLIHERIITFIKSLLEELNK